MHLGRYSTFWHCLWVSPSLPVIYTNPFLVTGGSAAWLRGRYGGAIAMTCIAGVAFRAEVGLLAGLLATAAWMRGRMSAREILSIGAMASIATLCVTTPLDTWLWRRYPLPLWPEAESFLFNVVNGKSSEWGTEPVYFYAAQLARLTLNPLTLVGCVGAVTVLRHVALNGDLSSLLAAHLAYVGIYSLLPHKEWRFVVYCVPVLTAVAANAGSYV